jgi:predicted RND superfamily exporter protein
MLEKFALACIKFRKSVLAVVAVLTVIFAYFAQNIEVKTVFDDLMPTSHPYVQIHNEYKNTFGGTNIITFMIEAEEGDIFQMPVLKKVRDLTQGLYKINAINEFQIYSIAGKKLKEVRASTEGIESFPYMWPALPEDEAGSERLRDALLPINRPTNW